MDRREAIKITSTIFGGMIIGAEAFLAGCESKKASGEVIFGEDHIQLLNEIGETIIPETDSSPGAKATNVGEFMKVMVNDCYDPDEQKIFIDGLTKINDLSKEKYDKPFIKLSAAQKQELLLSLEKESRDFLGGEIEEKPGLHYYTLFKQLTVLGFLTSEVGQTKAMRYAPVPGRYDACLPYEKGEKAWA